MSEELVFPASKKKAAFLLLGSLGFVVLGIWILPKHPVIGWLSMVFFGFGIPVSIAMFIPNKIYLKLDPEGFEFGTLLKKCRTSWKDVDGFDIAVIKGSKMIAIFYNEAYEPQQMLRKASALVAGVEGGIPNNYTAPLPEILTALQDWHARYGRNGA